MPPPEEPPKTPPQRKKLLIAAGVVLALLAGIFIWKHYFSGPSDAELAAAVSSGVKESMQHSFDTEERFIRYGLNVTEVVVVKKSGNEYQGVATVRTSSYAKHDVLVQITADPNGPLIWKTDPGAFLFLLQESAAPTPSWGGSPR